MRIAVTLAHRRGRRAWNDELARRDARELMRAITGGKLTPEQIDDLARAHLIENKVREEFFWRPRTIERARIEGGHHLQGALAAGRGVIVSYCHLGPHAGIALMLRQCGVRLHVVGGKVVSGRRKSRADARYQRQHLRNIEGGGGSVVPAAGSFETLEALLRQGETVGMAFDVRGRTPTPFLGRTVDLTSGTARLARATGALVVPVLRLREGHRMAGVLAPPLDPHAFEDALALHLALARRHDAWIARNPAGLRRTALSRTLIETPDRAHAGV
jgi:lauroyl/myristoyl acyltransferase